MDESEKKIKEKLLMSLINYLDDKGSERLAPKKVAVEVAAPDKEHLAEGLDKAKELLSSKEDPSSDDLEDLTPSHDGEDSDEDRLRALLADAGEDDEDEEPSSPFKRR